MSSSLPSTQVNAAIVPLDSASGQALTVHEWGELPHPVACSHTDSRTRSRPLRAERVLHAQIGAHCHSIAAEGDEPRSERGEEA